MNLACPVCLSENRDIDGFDLISVMGLMKEYNCGDLGRYLPPQARTDTVDMWTDRYFIEMRPEDAADYPVGKVQYEPVFHTAGHQGS
jgi:hypothetical protein